MAKLTKKQKYLKIFKHYRLPATLLLSLIILIILAYQIILLDKFSAFTFIGDTNISLLSQGQAIRSFQAKFNHRIQQQLKITSPNQQFTIDLATSSAKIDYSSLVETFNKQHPPFLWEKIKNQAINIFYPTKISPKITLSLDRELDKISKSVDQAPLNAQLIFNETTTPEGSPSANIQIKEAKEGLELDQARLEQAVEDYLVFGKLNSTLPTKNVPPKITTDHVQKAKQALETSIKEPVKLIFDSDSWVIDTKQLLALLDLSTGSDLLLDKDKTYTYLRKIASEIDQDVQEGLFEFNPETKRVTAFKPSQEGRKLNIDNVYSDLIESLTTHSSKTINLPVEVVKPKINTADVNNLGIKELLGRSLSNFAGSIPNRIYNVSLTAQKINGVLIPPGEIFSFNNIIGDITAATGFKQAYVIKEGRTVLDDGGGVCQDSTTLFRAVLNAGLPVVKRTAHAYRVGYYEQGFPPGLDATVFYPSVDFQFKNDTPAHILIQAYTYGTTLYVDLYGTSDGRVAAISKPVVTDQTPPPPDLRQDDPTLPKGTVKQVDFSAWGANVSFKRTVARNGETIINETWKSAFKPWQAIYLVGTKD